METKVKNISRQYLEFGRVYYGTMPYSEVCMHMRIAGTVQAFALVLDSDKYPMCRLLYECNDLETGFNGEYCEKHGYGYISDLASRKTYAMKSGAITLGEAGIYDDICTDSYAYRQVHTERYYHPDLATNYSEEENTNKE